MAITVNKKRTIVTVICSVMAGMIGLGIAFFLQASLLTGAIIGFSSFLGLSLFIKLISLFTKLISYCCRSPEDDGFVQVPTQQPVSDRPVRVINKSEYDLETERSAEDEKEYFKNQMNRILTKFWQENFSKKIGIRETSAFNLILGRLESIIKTENTYNNPEFFDQRRQQHQNVFNRYNLGLQEIACEKTSDRLIELCELYHVTTYSFLNSDESIKQVKQDIDLNENDPSTDKFFKIAYVSFDDEDKIIILAYNNTGIPSSHYLAKFLELSQKYALQPQTHVQEESDDDQDDRDLNLSSLAPKPHVPPQRNVIQTHASDSAGEESDEEVGDDFLDVGANVDFLTRGGP